MQIRISETTFKPTTISTLIAGEMIVDDGDIVMDIGCGSGVLSIIAVKLGATHVHSVDKSPDVAEVGHHNANENGVGDRISFSSGDLFGPIADDVTADVIIGDVSGIPDTLADDSGWFPTKGGGGARGSELPIRMLEDARRRLSPGGRIYLPTGTLQDEAAILLVAESLYMKVRQLTEKAIPLPADIAESAVMKQLVDAGIVTLATRGSRSLWTARVWEVSDAAALG